MNLDEAGNGDVKSLQIKFADGVLSKLCQLSVALGSAEILVPGGHDLSFIQDLLSAFLSLVEFVLVC